MNEIMVVYYGRREDIQTHLLYNLKILQILPSTESLSGFYLVEFKFGKKTEKKLCIDLEKKTSEFKTFLLYKYLSDIEIQVLSESGPDLQYYILSHRMFDCDYIKSQILNNIDQAHFIADSSNSTYLRNIEDVKFIFNTSNIFRIKVKTDNLDKEIEDKFSFHLPVIFLFFLKVSLNPISEIKQYAVAIQYTNLRLFKRFIEMILFFDFLFRSLMYPVFYGLKNFVYYNIRHAILYIARVIYYGVGYRIRHLVAYIWRIFYYQILFKLLNLMIRINSIIIYKLVYTIYYKFVYVIYYKVIYKLYYKLLYYLYYDIILKLFYKTRHLIMMTYYKSYGLVYDVSMFVFRFTKLVLLYPFYKIYWFCNFQYKKRLRKYFKSNVS